MPHALVELGRGLRQAALMLWVIAWPLGIGFLLSGLLRAFVSRKGVERHFADHRPVALLRASGFGIISSSCSYAAAALARTLIGLGADPTTAIAFMVAATNLVIELGVVIVVLLGWSFLFGELLGGVIMITCVGLLGGVVLSRARIGVDRGSGDHDDAIRESSTEDDHRNQHRLADAASFAISDLSMLKIEILGGVLAAGVLSVVVPGRWWIDLFLRGHGGWSTLENVLVAPFIAVVACVCSVGNVPLAATLWHEGIAFGGVNTFIFADLLAAPLLLTYRRYFGWNAMARIACLLYFAMVIAGGVVEEVFRSLAIVPSGHDLAVYSTQVRFDSTAILNVIAVVLFATAFVIDRQHDRFWPNDDLVVDPSCGMRVERGLAATSIERDGERFFFCSLRCAEQFERAKSPSTRLVEPKQQALDQ